jgi:hypothetical protein
VRYHGHTKSDPNILLPAAIQVSTFLLRKIWVYFQINWMLKDEIASALHFVQPVTSEMLSLTAEHVYNSKDRDNCTCEERPLQFVYGPDQSMPKFVEVRLRKKNLKDILVHFWLACGVSLYNHVAPVVHPLAGTFRNRWGY